MGWNAGQAQVNNYYTLGITLNVAKTTLPLANQTYHHCHAILLRNSHYGVQMLSIRTRLISLIHTLRHLLPAEALLPLVFGRAASVAAIRRDDIELQCR